MNSVKTFYNPTYTNKNDGNSYYELDKLPSSWLDYCVNKNIII